MSVGSSGLIRQAVELRADVIKADPTDDPADFHHAVRAAAPVPVLLRGGGRVAEHDLFARTRAMLIRAPVVSSLAATSSGIPRPPR